MDNSSVDYPAKNTRNKGGKADEVSENTFSCSTPIKDSPAAKKTPRRAGTPRTPRKPRKLSKKDEQVKDIRIFFPNFNQCGETTDNNVAFDHGNHVLGVNDLTLNSAKSSSFQSANCELKGDSANTTVEFESLLSWVESPRSKVRNFTGSDSVTNSCANMSTYSSGNATVGGTLAESNCNVELFDSDNQSAAGAVDLDKTPSAINTPIVVDEVTSKQEDLNDMAEISNSEICNMFKTMLSKMDGLQNKMKSIKTAQTNNAVNIKKIASSQKNDCRKIVVVEQDVKQVKSKIDQMADVISLQNLKIQELCSKVDRMESDRNTANLYIKGIVETRDEDLKEKVKNFFKDKMCIEEEVPVNHVSRVGKGKVKSVFVVLKNPKDKARIYSNMTNLQENKNEFDKHYRVEDHLPAKQRAQQNKNRHALWRNKVKATTAENLLLSVKKGQLMLNNN